MSVNLEQIEMLRERANVSYAEAKELLEKCNGDLVEALIMLEAQAKVRTPRLGCCDSGAWKTSKGLMNTIKRMVKKGNETKFVITKKENTVMDLPLNVPLLVTVAFPPLAIGGILLAMVTNHKISFIKPDGQGMKINNTFDKISTCVNSVSNQVVEAIKEDESKTN